MTETLRIRELDPDLIAPSRANCKILDQGGSRIAMIGKPGVGKSTTIEYLMYQKCDIFTTACVMSGTEEFNKFFGKFMPPSFVHYTLDLDQIERFEERQKFAREYFHEYAWSFLVIDDLTDDKGVLQKAPLKRCLKNSRHWKSLFVLSLQYGMDVIPSVRNGIDFVFIFREPLRSVREGIWKHYASIIPTFAEFCELMDTLTDDRCALVINNGAQSNNLEDCVFYFKARPIPPELGFKFGAYEYNEYDRRRAAQAARA